VFQFEELLQTHRCHYPLKARSTAHKKGLVAMPHRGSMRLSTEHRARLLPPQEFIRI
jgi:hypothetical protein